MSKQSQISNLRGIWSRIKAKMTASDIATLNEAKAYADQKAASLNTLEQVVLAELPAQGEAKKLYFIPADGGSGNNVYNEFVWMAAKDNVPAHFEQVGSTAYQPTHDASYNSETDKVAISINGTTYLVPYIAAPSVPILKQGNTVVSNNDTFVDTLPYTLTCETAGAEIRFTTDGTTPTASSSLYQGGFVLAQDSSQEFVTYIVKAIAFVNGVASSEMSVSVLVYTKLSKPTFSVAAGTYNTVKSVEISAEAGSTIYYTDDGTTPSANSSKEYIGAITVGVTTTIKAIAVQANRVQSDVTTATYTMKVAAPMLLLDNLGKYVTSRTITVTKNDADATYEYKIGASGTWTVLSGTTITATISGTYYVRATRQGWSNSNNATIDVLVGYKKCYIGRTTSNSVSSLSELSDRKDISVDTLVGTEQTNTFTGDGFIWFIVPSGVTISNVTSSGYKVNVDLIENQISGYNCYRRPEEDVAGTYTYNFE